MQKLKSTPDGLLSRDPVAVLVEKQLREMTERAGTTLLLEQDDHGRVKAQWGDVSVSGKSVDIAIMRLANGLLDDPRYTATLTVALSRVIGNGQACAETASPLR